jgi:hypothetical protein
MKKQIFIITGAVIVLILILVWAYLLVFGTPKTTEEIYTDLGLRGEENTMIEPLPPVEETPEKPLVQVTGEKLRQLTTKAVAGYKEVAAAAGADPVIYYVEKGTGHIYSINLKTGAEARLSGTTIAQTSEADISKTGSFVVVASQGSNKNKSIFVGELNTTENSLDEIFTETVHDFTLADSSGELLYTLPNEQSLVAYSYNISADTKKTLFTVPFREATIVWGNTATSSHYIYPKTSYALSGFLYEAKGSSLTRLPVEGFGFSAIANNEIILYSAHAGTAPASYVYNRKAKTKEKLNTVLLPEKCDLPESGTEFICGSEAINLPYEFPDQWHKGQLHFKDIMWSVTASSMTSTMLVDTFDSAREIDITMLEVNDNRSRVYFINKNDNTLWMYEI